MMANLFRDPYENSEPEPLLDSNTPLEELVVRACYDYQAFTILYEKYKKSIMRLLVSIVCDTDIATDLVQETFIRLWKTFARPELLPKDLSTSFVPWLYTITRRVAIDYFRHAKPHLYVSLNDDTKDEVGAYHMTALLSVASHEDQVCERHCLAQAITAISPKYRICWVMQNIHGMKQQDIANELHMNVKTVSSYTSRGNAQFRFAYKALMQGDGQPNDGRSK